MWQYLDQVHFDSEHWANSLIKDIKVISLTLNSKNINWQPWEIHHCLNLCMDQYSKQLIFMYISLWHTM